MALLAPGAEQEWRELAGGVSCDAWEVRAGGRCFCVKRPLAKLRVAADWRAPVGRVEAEYRWFEFAREAVPGSAPQPLALDRELRLIAMEWLAPERYPLWKGRLLAGEVDPSFAGAVGERLARLHAASARRPQLPARFANDAAFFALRLDAYLLEAGRRNPAVKRRLANLVARTARTKRALVHGDVSPKNILMGADGPVFLDAETATWGDPAFDLAFCLNHLLLKQTVVPQARAELAASFAALAAAYLGGVDWEPRDTVEMRAATLLPGLLLARVDGKSPVEYLADEAARAPVRAVALELLKVAPERLGDVLAMFSAAMA
ncbi:MAG TPA: phosphotransferase [Caulobacteraceae bacterium]|nr:phosphotransferase [Caulobacteraceae bacterium]